MNYTDTLDWMFNQLPFYQKEGAVAFKPGLDRIKGFCQRLGNPQDQLDIIHVGGTNGKGSTAHFIASVLQEAGYRVGLYTSPHLVDFRERIKINGVYIYKETVVAFIAKYQNYIRDEKLSFFEITLALALEYFNEQAVDYAVIEVGMGGRLDATNIVTPLVSVITNIGLDHTHFLGDNHASIAEEKAGIIKPHTPVIIGEDRPDTRPVFDSHSKQKKARIYYASASKRILDIGVSMPSYQQLNMQTAYTALNRLPELNLTPSIIRKGFLKVQTNTKLKGRWQTLNIEPKVIVDVSHNKEGFYHLKKNLSQESYNRLHIVIGFVQGKPITALLEMLPSEAHYYFCSPKLFRAFPVNKIKALLPSNILFYNCFESVESSYLNAIEQATTKDLIVVTGSTFVVGEVIENLQAL